MTSGFTTRGRGLFAAGVAAGICSLILDERDLLRVAVFVLALPLLAALLTAQARVRLQARREPVPRRFPAGHDGEVRLHVRAPGKLPTGGVLLEDTVPHALGARPRFALDRLRGPVTVSYPVRSDLRGIYRVGPVRARVRDPFGLTDSERVLADRSTLVVVPATHTLSDVPVGWGPATGDDGSARLRPGQGEDDVMIREHRNGDDMRRVHWKATAHRDELMVRVDERPWGGGTTVLLDRRAAAHRGIGAESSLEWAISFSASTVLHLRTRGHSVHLRTTDGLTLPVEASHGARLARPEEHGDDRADMLESLAALAPSHQRDLAPGADPGSAQALIAILGATTPAAVSELTRLRPAHGRSHAVLLDVGRWDTAPGDATPDQQVAARMLRAAGWGVVLVDGPQEGMQETWRRLCHPGIAANTSLTTEAPQ